MAGPRAWWWPPARTRSSARWPRCWASARRRATPLQQRLAAFGKRLSLVVLAICAVVFTIGVLRGEPVLLMALTAISLAVAAIPEALPAVVTVLLALGARRLVATSTRWCAACPASRPWAR
jgi:P-type E1-E2 ATPase